MQVFNRWTQRTSVIHSDGFSSLSCATQRLPCAVTSASEASSMPYQQNVIVWLQCVSPCCHGYFCCCGETSEANNAVRTSQKDVLIANERSLMRVGNPNPARKSPKSSARKLACSP